MDVSPFLVFGQAEIKLTLEEKADFLLYPGGKSADHRSTLVSDFIQEHKATIDLRVRELLIERDQVTCKTLCKPLKPAVKLGIHHLVHTVCIPPCSELLVKASTTDLVSERTNLDLVEGSSN